MDLEFNSVLGGGETRPDMDTMAESRWAFEDNSCAYALAAAFAQDPEAIREVEAAERLAQPVQAAETQNDAGEALENVDTPESAAAAGTAAVTASVAETTILDEEEAADDPIANVFYLSGLRSQNSDEADTLEEQKDAA